jgi:transposase, IS5 family
MQAADFFRSRIDAMINLKTPWRCWQVGCRGVKSKRQCRRSLSEIITQGRYWKAQDMFGTTETVIGAGRSNAGRPKLPIRLMASLLYLKHSFNLSDEELVVRWSENVLWQFCSGQDYFEHRLPCDATQIGRFAATWAKKAWSGCSRPPSTPPLPWRPSNPKTWSA